MTIRMKTICYMLHVTGFMLLAFSVSAQTWQGPPPGSIPPANNRPAPIDVGTTAQTKSGAFTATTVTASGGNLFVGGVQLQGGTTLLSLQSASGAVSLSFGGDLYAMNGKAIRADGAGVTNLYVGNWGVGATGIKLSVLGGTSVVTTPKLCFSSDGTTTSCLTSAPAGSQWTTEGTAVYYNGGNVGVGTTAPGRKLELSGTTTGIKITDTAATGNAFVELSTVDGGLSYFQNVGGRTRIYVGGGERMTFTNTGNVGIGTTAPGAKLEVAGQIKVTGGSPGAGKVLTSDTAGLASWQTVTGGIGGNGTANYVSKWTGGASLGNSTIYDSGIGNVGIGTTAPGANLQITGTAGAQGRLAIAGTESWTHWHYGVNEDNYIRPGKSAGANRFDLGQTYFTGGNVGIGTTAPAAKLSFNDLNDSSNGADGITWYNPIPTAYGIYRTAGAWAANDYQQLKLAWQTGIVLDPGSLYGKSYVDVQGGGLRVTAGNVGIGTTGPGALLDVKNQLLVRDGSYVEVKPGGGTYGLIIRDQNTDNWGNLDANDGYLAIGYLNDNGPLFVGTSNVGIGTTSPNAKLEVNGAMRIGADVWHTSGDGSQRFYFSPAGTTYIKGTGIRLRGSADTDLVTMTDTGNVGIGTTLPLNASGYTALSINSSTKSGMLEIQSAGIQQGLFFYDGTNTSTRVRAGQTANLVFDTGGNERMRIDTVGNVGIGTTAPGAKLEVAGQVKITGGLPAAGKVLTSDAAGLASWQTPASGGLSSVAVNAAHLQGNGTAASPLALATGYADGSAYDSRFVNVSGDTMSGNLMVNGNVGIGITSPTSALDVSGTARLRGQVGAIGLYVNSSGNVGIGTLAPNKQLHVKTASGNNAEIDLQSGDSPYWAIYQDDTTDQLKFWNNGANRLTLSGTGQVGIGTDNPQVALDVNGTIRGRNIGTTFTRWGYQGCPSGTSLVYNGYVAGPPFNQGGGGRNTLCLSNQPTWITIDATNQDGNLIYGTEWETGGYPSIGALTQLQDYDAVCSVCLEDDATMTLMVPGTQFCPLGWGTQYWGYLMSSHFTYGASETVCVDARSYQFTGSNANANGNLWFPTEAECGSLPCPPYVQDREVTCAVCTK